MDDMPKPPINGFVELIKTNGTITLLIQARGKVYEWDEKGTFTLKGIAPRVKTS